MATQLRMHQAYQGDFLSLKSNDWRAIIDTGTAGCADRLRRVLSRQRPNLLVITHLDADHFGGLCSLLESNPSGLELPPLLWLNHFEAEEGVGSLANAIGGAATNEPLSQASIDSVQDSLEAAVRRIPGVQDVSWYDHDQDLPPTLF